MTRLVRAEWLRWRTVRAGVVLAAAAVLVHVALAVGSALTAGHGGNAALGTATGFGHVLRGSGVTGWAALLLGVLAMAGETHHGTATTIFLVEPRRARVMGAKVIAQATTTLVVGAIAIVLGVLAAWPVYVHRGVALGPFDAHAVAVATGSLGATALLASLGVGVGALVTNQTVAVGGSIVWFAVAEGVLSVPLGPSAVRYLPGTAAVAVAGGGGGRWLAPWAAALVLAAYAALALVTGSARLARAEIS